MAFFDHQTIIAGQWARRYADLGFNPLPSRHDAKRPALGSYKRWLTDPIPRDWIKNWHWRNIQLVCGVRWGLLCVDIDGEAGMAAWRKISSGPWIGHGPWGCLFPSSPRNDNNGSRKLFFRLGKDCASVPTRVLWSGGPHEEVKVIGDGGLAIVPPSIHPFRKVSCEWMNGPIHGLGTASLPFAPDWLILLALQDKKRPSPECPRLEPSRKRRYHGSRLRSDEVLAALGDRKLEIAKYHGLRVSSNGAVFVRCHAADRQDDSPSCTMDLRTGRYFDWTANESCSFWDLLVKLDPSSFPTWQDARHLMGVHCFGGQS